MWLYSYLRQKWLWKSLVFLAAVGMLTLMSTIAVKVAIAHRKAPTPQAVLVLEGNVDRIIFTAQFMQSHSLPIWVSGNPKGANRNRKIFHQAGIPTELVHYDFCGVDTVTNFTCNAEMFAEQGIQHVYVITSDYHMRRSQAIAALVLGSQGIAVTPVEVGSENHPSESLLRTVRDCIRSVVWMATGWTGANLRKML